jgi:hypothetical protein
MINGTMGKEPRIAAIYKIWKEHGNKAFKSTDLKAILTKEECKIANMNGWHWRKIVERGENIVGRGKTTRTWKLSGYAREMCRGLNHAENKIEI